MPKIRISKAVIQAMIDHARAELPYEACGYLALEGDTFTRHYPLTNLDRSHEHFTMEPREQFAAIGDMRTRGLKPAAVYHSHPDTPARPSEEDIRLAHDPDISYVIVSVATAQPVIKSFRIRKGEVTPEEIEIL